MTWDFRGVLRVREGGLQPLRTSHCMCSLCLSRIALVNEFLVHWTLLNTSLNNRRAINQLPKGPSLWSFLRTYHTSQRPFPTVLSITNHLFLMTVLSSPGQLQAPWYNVAAGHALSLLWGQTLDCPASCPLPRCSQASTSAPKSQPRESSSTSPLCDGGQIFTKTELCQAGHATTSLIVTFSSQLFVF